MLRLTGKTQIGNLVFRFAHSVEIESTWRNFTSTCVIQLPRNLRTKETQLKKLIKKGDPVTVHLGYENQNTLEFQGYVSVLKPTVPLVVECEDEMYQLKRNTFTKSWRSVSAEEVIQLIYPGEIRVIGADLGPFTINKATGAQVLEKLKETYGLNSFFRGKTLVVGYIYDPEITKENKYHMQRNVITNDLEWRDQEDVKLKVKAISILPDNTKIEEEIGDKDGEERTLHFYNLSKSELIKRATAELEKLKFDGYRGKLTAFGVPMAEHGDIAVIADDEYPEQGGKYFIDGVKKSWGVNGYRREIELGPKAS